MKITGGRQVHCHTNTRRIYENYRWEAGPLSHKYKTNIWKLQVGGRFTVTQIQDEYMKITGGRQVHCHTNTRQIYENYRWEAGSLSHKYKTNIWKLQVGGRFTVTQIQDEYMKITGGRQVHCHTNTRRIYENYRWEAGPLSHKYKTNIWKLQVGGRSTVTQIQDEYMKITGGRQVHCHTNTRRIYENDRWEAGSLSHKYKTNIWKLQVGGRFTVTQIQDEYMKITGGRQVHCHTNTRRIYENYRWEAGSLSHKYKTNIWKLQVGGRFTVTQIQDECMKITGGRQVHCHTNTRRIYENYRWEAGSLSHKYKTNIWKLQVGGRFTVTQIQDEYMKITGGRQVHCHTNTRRIYENYRWEAGSLSHKYKTNIWKLQVGGRFTVTQIQDEYMKITGGRQVHCHTNTRRIYENYRWEAGSLSHKYKTNIWKLQVGGRSTVTQIQDKYMKITGGRQVHCHTNTRRIYENYRWEAGSLSHKYKTNIWKLQVGGRFTVTQIQDEYMKITGGRQVHCHTNTRRIYENYRWEAGSLSHKYKRNIWKLQVGGRFTVTQIQEEYMKIKGGRQVHCHTNTRRIYENYRWEAGSLSHKYKTNIWKLQVGGRFTVTQIQDEYMKITGGRQVHCHTNTRRIYENYRWEAGSLSHKYKTNIWKLQVGGRFTVTQIQDEYMKITGGRQVHCHTNTRQIYENYRWEAGSLSHKYKRNIWKLKVGGRSTVTQIKDKYMKITGGRQVHCHTNTRGIYENYRWEACSLSHKYKTNIWKLQVGGRFTVTHIQDEYMKITGERQVHCHTNKRNI